MRSRGPYICVKMYVYVMVITVLLIASLCAPPVSLAQGGEVVHIVKHGETLYAIATQYGVTCDAIMSANGISNPDLVYIGQVLKIPGTTAYAAPGYAQPPSTSPAYAPAYGTNLSQTYVVQSGDTLSGIAWLHGTTVDALMSANNLTSDVIWIGQQLVVPGVYAPPAYGYEGKPAYGYEEKPAYDYEGKPAYGYEDKSAYGYDGRDKCLGDSTYCVEYAVAPAPAPDYDPSVTCDETTGDCKAARESDTTTYIPIELGWYGRKTVDFADPDENTTVMVRTVGKNGVRIKMEGPTPYMAETSTYPEFGDNIYAFRWVVPGKYIVTVDGEPSNRVEIDVNGGSRTLVEFTRSWVAVDSYKHSPSGWRAEVVLNTSTTGVVESHAIGWWSILNVNAGGPGQKVVLMVPNTNFRTTCTTGEKIELGPGGCVFGGLGGGKYAVTMEGSDLTLELYLDGNGRAEVQFWKEF